MTQTSTSPRAFGCYISKRSRSNWDVCRTEKLWGFTKKAFTGLAQTVKPGDYLWFLVGRDTGGVEVVALSQAATAPQPVGLGESAPWEDGRDYAATLPVKFLHLFDRATVLRFPRGSGRKINPETRIDALELQKGFFPLDVARHDRLTEVVGLGDSTKRVAPDDDPDEVVLPPDPEVPRYWLVTQGRTYSKERSGGYLWAPQTGKHGRALRYHTSLLEVQPGDKIVHYANGEVRAVSAPDAHAVAAERPEELPADAWRLSGYRLDIQYHELVTPFALVEIPLELRKEEAARHPEPGTSPFNKNGTVAQGYLFPLSNDFVRNLIKLRPADLGELLAYSGPPRVPLPPTTREAIVHAMRSFDARERVPTWPGWALRPNERWGIRFEDRLYPVKRIVSAVTRVPVSRFSGGMQHANRYVEGYGFEVRRLEAPAPAVEPAVPDLQAVAARVKQVAAGLFLEPPNYLDDVLDLLIDRRQVIFYGPPGTGKTYIARKLAEACAGAKDRVTPVQFHPSYSYEDFVWGYRPKADGTFRLEDGPLLVAARAAREQPGEIHVILIDEFNRGNIAKVFGELYYLLEYRDEDLQLQYGRQEKFRLPKNLWFIGTMNTADRSLALLDAALRRRFYFVEFFPDEPPIKGLLARWLKDKHPTLDWVAEVVDKANELLQTRHAAIGPSYFLRESLDERWVATIWQHAVKPYIEEQLIGEENRLAQFELEKLRAAIKPPGAPIQTPPFDGNTGAPSPAS